MDMMLIAVHEVVDEVVPYVDGNFAAAQIAQSSTLLHLERNPVVEKRKKSTLSALQALCLGEMRLENFEVTGGEMDVI